MPVCDKLLFPASKGYQLDCQFLKLDFNRFGESISLSLDSYEWVGGAFRSAPYFLQMRSGEIGIHDHVESCNTRFFTSYWLFLMESI